ncbi:hypothetical protein PWG15_34245 (plasmid) [Ensifer adhaerens]|uniref:hypothetical protein n=1 Tax=Ensifer adhaerens TaxID=106592 RepID=UPI0023A95C05|nr:hypothetical protein [Ensifer adhaerens]WDZ81956.1 hypothetical protein PWG15_34245 [Ensifer adhaerens]
MTKVDPELPDGISAANQGGSPEHRARHLRDRAVAEAKHFLVLFLYLWVLFGLFVLNERIILHQHKVDFVSHGFAVFNAFILAKVMLIIEDMNLGRWLDNRPLIYPILYNSLIFSTLFILFHVIEEKVVSIAWGEPVSASIPNIGGGGIAGIACVSVILFFSLIPFFAFRNLARALGLERLNSMLFSTEVGDLAE